MAEHPEPNESPETSKQEVYAKVIESEQTSLSSWDGEKIEVDRTSRDKRDKRDTSLFHFLERLIPDFVKNSTARHLDTATASKTSTTQYKPPQSTVPGTKEHSDAIDRQLEEASQRSRDERKAIILGAFRGEPKHQIMLMMKILQQNGLSEEELQAYRPHIIEKLVDDAKTLIRVLVELDTYPDFIAKKHRKAVEIINTIGKGPQTDFSAPKDDFVAAVEAVRADADVQTLCKCNSEHNLTDSSE